MARSIEEKREREKEIVSEMIEVYCHAQHGKRDGLCPQCAEIDAYARERSDRCPVMENKTFCSNCPVHCYRPEMRERIREVMRFAGPRMITRRPIAAMRHVIETKREKKRLEAQASDAHRETKKAKPN